MSTEARPRFGASPARTLVLSCPDWPVVVVTAGATRPIAVLEQHLVVAASAMARAEGVWPGQRQREAEAHCPGLMVCSRDRGGEARAFEPVVEVLESFGVSVSVYRPGLAAFRTRGPARRLGGEEGLARAVAAKLSQLPLPASTAVAADPCDRPFGPWSAPGRIGPWWRLGIAAGAFAAAAAAEVGAIVPPGEEAAFLAPLPVELLGDPELADLLRRLGLPSLGDFARLDEADVLARFGSKVGTLQRLAQGREERPWSSRHRLAEIVLAQDFEPPAERIESVVLVARAMVETLWSQLADQGRCCTLLQVELESAVGRRLERRWGDEGTWSPNVVAERLRWQLEAFLSSTGEDPRSTAGGHDRSECGGISALRLVPVETAEAQGRQLKLWGRSPITEERMARVLARLQGMLGAHAVLFPVESGGRGPKERIALVPVGDPAPIGRPGPWPGRLPPPAPAVVPSRPFPVRLVDANGGSVNVDARGALSAPPSRLDLGDGVTVPVVAWSSPWPADERWWDRSHRRRRARLQVLTATGQAQLLVLERGQWALEGRYD